MYEENLELDRKVQGKYKGGGRRGRGGDASGGLLDREMQPGPGSQKSKEELEMEAAIKASQQHEDQRKQKALSEEEMIAEAIRQS